MRDPIDIVSFKERLAEAVDKKCASYQMLLRDTSYVLDQFCWSRNWLEAENALQEIGLEKQQLFSGQNYPEYYIGSYFLIERDAYVTSTGIRHDLLACLGDQGELTKTAAAGGTSVWCPYTPNEERHKYQVISIGAGLFSQIDRPYYEVCGSYPKYTIANMVLKHWEVARRDLKNFPIVKSILITHEFYPITGFHDNNLSFTVRLTLNNQEQAMSYLYYAMDNIEPYRITDERRLKETVEATDELGELRSVASGDWGLYDPPEDFNNLCKPEEVREEILWTPEQGNIGDLGNPDDFPDLGNPDDLYEKS